MSSALDDLRYACIMHGNYIYRDTALQLLELAKQHRERCAETCSTGEDIDTEEIERRIKAFDAGRCKDVAFSYDPRGCTVRLLFRDGYSNSIAGGYGI